MVLIRGKHNIPSFPKGCVATIGNFDGMHLGHQAILKQVKTLAKQYAIPSVVVTFEPLPQEFFKGSDAPNRLMRIRDKQCAFTSFELDYSIYLQFNHAFSQWSAEYFIQELLINYLNIKHLIVGEDFHFGYQRKGNFALLKTVGEKAGFTVYPTPLVLADNGERISSTLIRSFLKQGKLEKAKHLLNHAYFICGRVKRGEQRGRILSFPTANVYLPYDNLPLRGVYCVLVKGVATQALPGVANIGNRPTVDGKKNLLEVHLLNYQGDLYQRAIKVEFLAKLREEMRFASLAELQQQIAQDVKMAKDFFSQFRDES